MNTTPNPRIPGVATSSDPRYPNDHLLVTLVGPRCGVTLQVRADRREIFRGANDPRGTRTALVGVSRESLLQALTTAGVLPDASDVVVRESDLPAVTWDPARRHWKAGDQTLTAAAAGSPATLRRRERWALTELALVHHARIDEPPEPEPTNAERLAELIRNRSTSTSPGDIAAALDAAGVKAPEATTARCTALSSIHERRCERNAGHEGRHEADGGAAVWANTARCDVMAVEGDECPLQCAKNRGHLGPHVGGSRS